MQDLAERVRRTGLLLETLNDPYPTPRGALETPSGPAESRRVPCGACKRQGWIRTRRGLLLCLGCDGVGWRLRGPDDEPWDEYVELPTAEAAQLPVMPSLPSALAIEARLQEEADEREGRLERLAYSWERARHAADRHGSYPEIRRALVRLEVRWRYGYLLVRRVVVEQEPVVLEPRQKTLLDLAVVKTALLARPPLKLPPWIERRVAGERIETIVSLAAAGLTAGEIARRLGVPKKIVKRRLRRPGVESAAAGAPARAA